MRRSTSPRADTEEEENGGRATAKYEHPTPLVESVTTNLCKVSLHQEGLSAQIGMASSNNYSTHLEQEISMNGKSKPAMGPGMSFKTNGLLPQCNMEVRTNNSVMKLHSGDMEGNDACHKRVIDTTVTSGNDGREQVEAGNGNYNLKELEADIEAGDHNSDESDDDDDDDEDDEEDQDVESDDIAGVEESNEEEVDVEEISDESDSSSFLSSSSSDDDHDDEQVAAESECEEGELKESSPQRGKASTKRDTKSCDGDAWSSEDEGPKEPVRLRNELKDLPYVPKVSITLQPYHQMVPVGVVSSLVGVSAIVEGVEGEPPLNEGSILWLTEQRLPLGVVDELFGPVKKPFYVVRYNDAGEVPDGVKDGAKVSYVRDFADFVLNNPSLFAKGYDQCADNDEEPSCSEVEFSDDEKEAEYRRSKARSKRAMPEATTCSDNSRTGRHQNRRARGRRPQNDQSNPRMRGESRRMFQSNNVFPGGPSQYQTQSEQHRNDRGQRWHLAGEREREFQYSERKRQFHCQGAESQHYGGQREEPEFGQWVEPGPAPNKASKQPAEGQSLAYEKQCHRPTRLGPARQPLEEPPPAQTMQINQSHPLMEPTLMQQVKPLQMAQVQGSPQFSQQGQPLQTNQPHDPLHHLTTQHIHPSQMNQPSFVQPSLQPQAQLLQMMNQAHPPHASLRQQQPSVGHHSQMPMVQSHSAASVTGQVATSGGYVGPSMVNILPLQAGMEIVQGVPVSLRLDSSSSYQPPMSQHQPHQSANHFSPLTQQHICGPAPQPPPNIGMPTGHQMQVPSAALVTPVLGIPAGPIPYNSAHMAHNQQVHGLSSSGSPAFGQQCPPAMPGLPDQYIPQTSLAPHHQHLAQTSLGPHHLQQVLQGSMAPHHQQNLPQNSPGLHQQPHPPQPAFSNQRQGGPYQGRMF